MINGKDTRDKIKNNAKNRPNCNFDLKGTIFKLAFIKYTQCELI